MFFNVSVFSLLLGLVWTSSRAQAPNTLSAQEKKEGWTLLFDSHDLKGWHKYNGKAPGPSWRTDGGTLHLYVPQRAGNKAPDGGDLVTDAAINGDFEFKAEWKVDRFTNNGIFFFVQEAPQYKNIYDTGLELQIQDDAIYEGATETQNRHRAGDLYGVATASIRELKPVGQWNQLAVTMRKNRLTVVLNGYTIHEHDLTSADWKQRIAGSKIKDAPISKGKFNGRIGLQDWGSSVWYRNVKLLRL